MSISEYIENFHKMTTREELNELKEAFGKFTLAEQLEVFSKLKETV